MCPLPVCQWYLVLHVFFVIGQASHDFASFLTALLIIDNQWTPVSKESVDFLFWEDPSGAGRFLATFFVIRGSHAPTPSG
jgi:hypothetical protein